MDSYFEKGIILEGTLWVKGKVHFGASIKGDVHSSDHLIISPSGYVNGSIYSYNLSNSGKIVGDIFSKNKTILLNGGDLTGDISTYQLVVDEGADFGGHCKMMDAPVEQNDVRSDVKVETSSKKNSLLSLKSKSLSGEVSNSRVTSKIRQLKLFSKLPKIAGVFVIGFLFIWTFSFFISQKNDDTENLIKFGYDLLREKNYEKAEHVFKDVLKKGEDSPKVYAGLGEIYLQRKLYEEAINQFKRSVESMPSNVDYKISLAKTYQSMGHLKDAEKYFQLALDENSNSATSFYQYGLFLEEKGNVKNAISHYRKALGLDKNLYEARKSLGKLFEKTGQLDKAITQYTLALKHDKKNSALHLALGSLLLNSKDSSKANSHFNEGLKLVPKNFKVHIKVASMLMKKGMLDQSLALYEIASFIEPNNAEVHSSQAKIFLKKKRWADALISYKKSVKLNPKNAENQYQLGRLFALDKKFKNAREALEKALSLRDNHPPTYYELGRVLLEESKPIEAELVFFKAVAGDSKNIIYSLSLADAEVINKKNNSALKRLLKLLDTYPENLDVLFSLCNVYSKKRFYTAAIGHCESALDLNPKKDKDMMNRLAWLYAKKRINLDRGIKLIKEVIQSEPNTAKYIDTMSELLYAKGDIVEAVKTIRKAISLEPKNAYYKQQIWKFKNVPFESR
jgi:tetratricopeptide (TPR) repeat protein/cytoskeletal protein CcmA (bactofilin family)